MFEQLKKNQEREVFRHNNQIINSMKRNDKLAVSRHLSSLVIAATSICLILLAVVFFDKMSGSFIIACGISLVAAILIFFHELNKRKITYLRKYEKLLSKIKSIYIRHIHADYLAKYFWMSTTLLIITMGILVGAYLIGQNGWVTQGFFQSDLLSSDLSMVINTASGLLAAQIALFSFMMQQVLSKYSGVVAQTVANHRVFKVLALFPMLGLFIPYLLHNFGSPKAIENIVLPVIGFMLLLSLLITVVVAKSGLSENLAIRYFGEASSKKINKAIPTPFNTKPNIFWRVLQFLGLDFRNKDRFQAINVPKNGTNITIESLNASLGVANKAVIEGQHDVFVASLASIETMMFFYALKRKSYYSSEDDVFTYLNYQFSALVESTAKAPNQYLIANLTDSIGSISKLTYSVGNKPTVEHENNGGNQSYNSTTALWMGLLLQCFEHTHKLARCTAAHSSLRQMSALANAAITNRDSDLITITYLPSLAKAFGLCLVEIKDPYHKDLAGLCLTNLMENLRIITNHRDLLSKSHADPFEDTVKYIDSFTALYFIKDSTGSLELNDPVNNVLTKKAPDMYCIQEIFFIIANKSIPDISSYHVAIRHMEVIIEVLAKMASFGLQAKIYNASYYLQALFEILYIVLRGLPIIYKKHEEAIEDERARIRSSQLPISTERRLIELTCKKINELIPLFYNSRRTLDWQHPVFSSLGLLILKFVETNEAFIKSEISKIVTSYYNLVKTSIDSQSPSRLDGQKYLQLVGAWMKHFSVDIKLTESIETLLSKNYEHYSQSRSSSGNYGFLGYPTLHYNDFYLYPLENIRHPEILSDKHWENFVHSESKLINDNVLISFAEIVRVQAK